MRRTRSRTPFAALDVVALNSMVTYHGGPNEVPPGSRCPVATQLDPGTYVLLCFVASPAGTLLCCEA